MENTTINTLNDTEFLDWLDSLSDDEFEMYVNECKFNYYGLDYPEGSTISGGIRW